MKRSKKDNIIIGSSHRDGKWTLEVSSDTQRFYLASFSDYTEWADKLAHLKEMFPTAKVVALGGGQ